MKRKIVAAMICAAMVTGTVPGMALAAENLTDIQTVQTAEEISDEEKTSETAGEDELQDTDEIPEIVQNTDRMSENRDTEGAEDPEDAGGLSHEQLNEEPGIPEQNSKVEINTAENEPGITDRADAVIDTQEELEAAIAQSGEIDLGDQRIELTSALSINNDVVIKGGTLAGTDSVSGNLVTLMGNRITLDNVKIQTSAGNKSALHVYGTNLTVNGLTIDHSNAAGGAPVIINNGAAADFNGTVNLTLGSNSWYGINVDNAAADFSDAVLNATPVIATQSVVCLEGGASASGVALTVVVTENDGGANHRQTAYVADSNLSQFIQAKTAAGADISLIELNKDVTLTAPLFLSEAMTVRSASGSYRINGSDAMGAENVVTITSDGVMLDGIGIRTAPANKSALHVYKASASLRNVTLDNQETAGGAAMIVNGSTVRVEGTLNLLLGENSWGGINVDPTNGAAGVTFTDGSKVTAAGSDQNVIYIDDGDDADQVTITGAEEAGLEQDAEGNYIVAGQDTDPEPEQPAGEEDAGDSDEEKPSAEDNSPENEEKPENNGTGTDGTAGGDKEESGRTDAENIRKAPQTGDSSTGLYIALTALLGSGTMAGTVLKRRRKTTK